MPTPSVPEIAATVLFGLALLHTFSVKQFHRLSHRFAEGSAARNLLHLLAEVEVVFGLWAAILVGFLALTEGKAHAVGYLESRNFTEALFVFVILVVSSTRPVLKLAESALDLLAGLLPLKRPLAFFLVTLVAGPLLGSLITEPAAMTVTALVLLERFYSKSISRKLRYATLGLLFVNVSIGGCLTPYAAPPVLMVAATWDWDLGFMLRNFGWKVILAILISTGAVAAVFGKEISRLKWESSGQKKSPRVPLWVTVSHVLFLGLIAASSHYPAVFGGLFLLFLGLTTVTREQQSELRLRQGLLVSFFLAGLVVLGGLQNWWLEPILTRLDALALFTAATALTAITDNAALTYLGSQVPSLAEASRYALVAGAVTGGGLTVIANAPNPAGYGILCPAFGEEGVSPGGLFTSALFPTAVAALCLWLL